jgi:hypothetical protein
LPLKKLAINGADDNPRSFKGLSKSFVCKFSQEDLA